jgi:hypothetical protein
MAQGSLVTSAITAKCYRLCTEATRTNPTERPSLAIPPSKCYPSPSSVFPLFLSRRLANLLTLMLVVVSFASDKRFGLVTTDKSVSGKSGVGKNCRSSAPNIHVTAVPGLSIGSMMLVSFVSNYSSDELMNG